MFNLYLNLMHNEDKNPSKNIQLCIIKSNKAVVFGENFTKLTKTFRFWKVFDVMVCLKPKWELSFFLSYRWLKTSLIFLTGRFSKNLLGFQGRNSSLLGSILGPNRVKARYIKTCTYCCAVSWGNALIPNRCIHS